MPRSYALFLMLTLCGAVGCAVIDVREEQSFHVISDNTRRANFGPWKFDPAMDSGDGATTFHIDAARDCDLHTDKVGERTTITRRENTTTGVTWVLGVIGVAGATALTWGLDQHFGKDKPLTGTDADGKSTLSDAGAAVYFGGAGSLGLISAVHAAVRSWDTETTEPVHEVSDDRAVCEHRPLSDARVQVMAGERLLGQGTTDDKGQVKLTCLAEQIELALEPPVLSINGERAEKQPFPEGGGFSHVAARLFQEGGAAADEERRRLGSGNRRTLALFGASLPRAERSRLSAAVQQAGSPMLEMTPHWSSFDVTSRAWPNATLLKLLFDGHGQFIKAKWEGDFRGLRQTELLKSLGDRFGLPEREDSVDGAVLLRWQLEQGLEVRFTRAAARDASTCPSAELSYIDPVAYAEFDAAVGPAPVDNSRKKGSR